MILPGTDKNFDKLADEVVTAHFMDDSSLQDNLIKVAGRESLNPNELQRLVEKTNTFASLRLLKTAEDKKAELALVDYDKALEQTHPKDSAPLTKEASVMTMPNMRRVAGMEKVAFQSLAPVEKVVKPNHIGKIFTLKKEANELRMKKVAAEISASNGLDSLLSDFFMVRGPDFQKFAGEALTLHGETCLPILDSLAANLKEPKEFSKVAELVDEGTRVHKTFHTVLGSLHTIIKLAADLEVTEANLSAAWAASKV